MFGWLAKLLVESPIQGSGCSCCAGKKKQLEEMQKALGHDDFIPQEETNKQNFNSGHFSAQYSNDGTCKCHEYTSIILGELNNDYPKVVTDSSDDEQTHHCGCDSCNCSK